MKCTKCKDKNIIKACFCKNCRRKFTKEEQELAKKKSIVGLLEKVEKIYNTLNLSFITDNIIFKILSILLVLLIGISYYFNNGFYFKLLNSKEYDINYNTKLEEYYLISKKNKIALNFYIPNRVKNLELKHYTHDKKLIDKTKYKKDENIILETNSNDYYIIEIKYSNKKREHMKIYVIQDEETSDA